MTTVPKDYGFVYFIKPVNANITKIGYSNKNPIGRLIMLQTSHPETLIIYGIIACDQPKEIEQELHNYYQNRKIRGEWFKLTTKEIDDCLESLKSVADMHICYGKNLTRKTISNWCNDGYAERNYMKTTTFFGTELDKQLIIDAKSEAERQLRQPVSQSALLRTLMGLLAEGKIKLDITDVIEHSPLSFTHNGFKKKEE